MYDNSMHAQLENLCQMLNDKRYQELDNYPVQAFRKQYGNTTLIQILANNNNQEAIQYLLERGADINRAVAGAAMGGHTVLVNELLEKKADIDWAVDGAAQGGHRELMQDLLNREADIKWAAAGASRGGHTELVEELLEKGADINEAANSAALEGHTELVRKLHKRGADINHVINGAAMGGDTKLVEELLSEEASIDWAVHGAAMGGHTRLVQKLLPKGADINFAVHAGARGGHAELVEDLLKEGAETNCAVDGAALDGHKMLVEDLLIKGANIIIAFESASLGGHIELAKELMSQMTFMHNNNIDETNYSLAKEVKVLVQDDPRFTVDKAIEKLEFLTQKYEITFREARIYLTHKSWSEVLLSLESEKPNSSMAQVLSIPELVENISHFVYGVSHTSASKIAKVYSVRTGFFSHPDSGAVDLEEEQQQNKSSPYL